MHVGPKAQAGQNQKATPTPTLQELPIQQQHKSRNQVSVQDPVEVCFLLERDGWGGMAWDVGMARGREEGPWHGEARFQSL